MEVVAKLLRLFTILLELPDEDQLVRDHWYGVEGEDHLRNVHYAARSPEDNEQVAVLYAPGHTDLGTVTLLFRQPVAALQILNSDGQWRLVKPHDSTITINTCDALTALTEADQVLGPYSTRTAGGPGAFEPAGRAVYCHVSYQETDRIISQLERPFYRPSNQVVLDPVTISPLLNPLGLASNVFTELGQHLTT